MRSIVKQDQGGLVHLEVKAGIPVSGVVRFVAPGGKLIGDELELSPPWFGAVIDDTQEDPDNDPQLRVLRVCAFSESATEVPYDLRRRRVRVDQRIGETLTPTVERVEREEDPQPWEELPQALIWVRLPEDAVPVMVSIPELEALVPASAAVDLSAYYQVRWTWTELIGQVSADLDDLIEVLRGEDPGDPWDPDPAGEEWPPEGAEELIAAILAASRTEYGSTYYTSAVQVVHLDLTRGDFLDAYPASRSFLEGRRSTSFWAGLERTAQDTVERLIERHGTRAYCIAGEEQLTALLVQALRVQLALNGFTPKGWQGDKAGFLRDEREELDRMAADSLNGAYMDPKQIGSVAEINARRGRRSAWRTR